MGLFKKKSKSFQDKGDGTNEGPNVDTKKSKKFFGSSKRGKAKADKSKNKKSTNDDEVAGEDDKAGAANQTTEKTPLTPGTSPESNRSPGPVDIDDFDDGNEKHDLGDIPASISTGLSSQSDSRLPSPSQDEEDSLDSPCSRYKKSLKEAGDELDELSKEHTEIDGDEEYIEHELGDNDNHDNHDDNNDDRTENEDLEDDQDGEGQHESTDPPFDPGLPPSLSLVPQYIASLSPQISPSPSSELPARALRSLFALSEHASSTHERTAMVRMSDSKLIPSLLDFLKRCEKDSSEQYLTMLVLNNVSIPTENKRLIALDCGGTKILASLLCEDPGCHLLVIILVNLTFAELDVRRDLLNPAEDIQLVEALSYALMLASLTTSELSALDPIPLASSSGTPYTPSKLLSLLSDSLSIPTTPSSRLRPDPNASPLLLSATDDCPFPETARWCLCAFKNLTRPAKSPLESPSEVSIAAQAILDAGMVPILLRVIRVPTSRDQMGNAENFPCWYSNSAQDAALYTLVHMASVPIIRRILRDKCGCVADLTKIVDCGKDNVRLLGLATGGAAGVMVAGQGASDLGQLALQCLKARIAIAYILGSEGHYGQTQTASAESHDTEIETNLANYKSAMLLADHEAHSFMELLSHTLHNRPKEGPGGYSATTFTLKGVLHAVRCLLTDGRNRNVFAMENGARLNTLLLKVLAKYAMVNGKQIDADQAEYAIFSLYLMSNHGFHESVCFSRYGQNTFLPAWFGDCSATVPRQVAKNVITKILTSYLFKQETRPAGRHAANQILLRIKYLHFEGTVLDLTYDGKEFPSKTDFDMEDEILTSVREVYVERRKVGAKPKADIFDRTIVRYRIPANREGRKGVDPKIFANPLIAVEELSFGSSKVRHTGPIDDIAIANNIAKCAEGCSEQFYNYMWEWEDGGNDGMMERQATIEPSDQSDDSASGFYESMDGTERSTPYAPPLKGIINMFKQMGNKSNEDEPFSIFGLKCGAPLCGR